MQISYATHLSAISVFSYQYHNKPSNIPICDATFSGGDSDTVARVLCFVSCLPNTLDADRPSRFSNHLTHH